MPNDYFTLEEAHATLPKLRELVREARDLKRRADAKIILWRVLDAPDPVEHAMARGQVEFLLAEVGRRIESVHAMGCLVKDIDKGLVDFPGWIPGQGNVYLCWRLGEDQITYWHLRTEGYDARKPIQTSLFSLRKFS
jgi:hypothetical protein